MKRSARLSLASVGLLLLSMAALVTPAGATTATSLLHNSIAVGNRYNSTVIPVVPTSIVRLPSMPLVAGTHIYLHGQYSATESAPDKVLQAGQIWCTAGATTIKSQFTTVNRYSGSPTGQVWVSWLFDVPSTTTWSCELVGWADNTGKDESNTVVLNISSDPSVTYLYVNPSPVNGLGWQDSTASTPIASGSSLYMLRQTWPATIPTNLPASYISVMAESEVDDNYTNTSQSTTVTAKLYVQQLSGSAVCNANANFTTATTQTVTITSNMHHYKFYLNAVNVPVDPKCSKQWAIKVLIQNAGPTEAKVTQSGYSSALAVWGFAP